MSELLQDYIVFTGDVDTVAAIALAAGSCSEEIRQDIPNHQINNFWHSVSPLHISLSIIKDKTYA